MKYTESSAVDDVSLYFHFVYNPMNFVFLWFLCFVLESRAKYCDYR